MKRFDLQMSLPSYLSIPFRMMTLENDPRFKCSWLLYAVHRHLRMLIGIKNGMSSLLARKRSIQELIEGLSSDEPQSHMPTPPPPPMNEDLDDSSESVIVESVGEALDITGVDDKDASITIEEEVQEVSDEVEEIMAPQTFDMKRETLSLIKGLSRKTLDNLIAASELFFSHEVLLSDSDKTFNAMLAEVEEAVIRFIEESNPFKEFVLCTAAPEIKDLVFVWKGIDFTTFPLNISLETPKTFALDMKYRSVSFIGPGGKGIPSQPLVPIVSPESCEWFESPCGSIMDTLGECIWEEERFSAHSALARLMLWTIPEQYIFENMEGLAELGMPEVCGDMLLGLLLFRGKTPQTEMIEKAKTLFEKYRLESHHKRFVAYIIKQMGEEEKRLMEVEDYNGLTELLLARQEIEGGKDKVATLRRLANIFKEKMENHEGAYYCLLKASEIDLDDEDLMSEFESEAKSAKKHKEAAKRCLDLSKKAEGRKKANLALCAGRLALEVGEHKLAKEAFRIAVDAQPEDIGIINEAQASALSLQDYEMMASLHIKKMFLATDNQSRINAALAAANIYLDRLGKTEDALSLFNAALAIEPMCVQAFDGAFGILIQENRFEEARALCQNMLAKVSDVRIREDILKKLGVLLEEVFKDDRESANIYAELYAINPQNKHTLFHLAELYERLGDYQKLFVLVPRMIALEPDNAVPRLLHMAVLAFEHLKMPDVAIGFLMEAHQRDPQNVEIISKLRTIHEALGMWAEVAKDLELEAQAAEGLNKTRVFVKLADILFEKLGHKERTKATLWKALESVPKPYGESVRYDVQKIAERLATLHHEDGERDKEMKALEIEVLVTNEESVPDLMVRMAERMLEPPKQKDIARRYLEEAVKINPVHKIAVEMLARMEMEEGRIETVVAIVEPLAMKMQEKGDIEAERRLRQLAADASVKMGDYENAIAQYERLIKIDPNNQQHKIMLGKLYAKGGKDSEAFFYLSRILENPPELTPMELIELLTTAASCASKLGSHRKAMIWLEEASRLKGTQDIETLRQLMTEAESAGANDKLIQYIEMLVSLEKSPEKRFLLFLKAGDLYRDSQDLRRAFEMFQSAVEENPQSKAALHKLLETAVALGEFQEAKNAILRILAIEQDGAKRADYHYAVALLARDSLMDKELAKEHLWKAIELNPDFSDANSALEALLVETEDHTGLASFFQSQIKRYKVHGQDAKVGETLLKLSTLYEEKLHNLPMALETLQKLVEIVPSNVEYIEQLANLLTRMPEREREAIETYYKVLSLDPTREEAYRKIKVLYGAIGDHDGEWCAASALVALGKATSAERELFEAYRQPKLMLKRDVLPSDAFKRTIMVEGLDKGVARLFDILADPLRGVLKWKQAKDLGLSDSDLVDMSAKGVFQSTAQIISKVFGIPIPKVYIARGRSGLAKLPFNPPVLAVGEDVLTSWRGKQLRFGLGRAIISFAPGFQFSGIMDAATLRLIFIAGLCIAFPEYPVPPDAEGAQELASKLAKQLSQEAILEIKGLMTVFMREKRAIDMHAFLVNIDKTACRAGLFLANDLEVASQVLAKDTLFLSEMEYGDRLLDLCVYAVSPQYRELRKLMLHQ